MQTSYLIQVYYIDYRLVNKDKSLIDNCLDKNNATCLL